MHREQIFMEINSERMRQDRKWGAIASRSHEHMYWMTVLVEEVGEAAKEIWHLVTKRRKDRLKLKMELIHCAAVIVAWLEDRF